MGDDNRDGELSDPGAKVSVRLLLSCTGEIVLQLELCSGSDVRATGGLKFRFIVRLMYLQW